MIYRFAKEQVCFTWSYIPLHAHTVGSIERFSPKLVTCWRIYTTTKSSVVSIAVTLLPRLCASFQESLWVTFEAKASDWWLTNGKANVFSCFGITFLANFVARLLTKSQSTVAFRCWGARWALFTPVDQVSTYLWWQLFALHLWLTRS